MIFAVVLAEVSVTSTVASIADPVTFANVRPIIVVVVDECVVY